MDKPLRAKLSMRKPSHFFALGFGSGLAPVMPGTFGSLAAIPLIWLMSSYLSLSVYIALTIVASVIGVWFCGKTAEDMGVHDHSSIVWDEVAGMLICMIAVPLTWQNLLIGFCLFRFFDIVKPWPISYLDKHLHGGLGIMLDDLLAGVFAMLCVHGLLYLNLL